jgi:HEAT repeat protein
MLTLTALTFSAFLHAQDDPARRAQELVEKLRSDRLEVREDAARKLKDLGTAALPELEKAAQSADVEVSERSRSVLKVIRLRLSLTPNLVAKVPDVVERLTSGDGHAWTVLFLEIADKVTFEGDLPDTWAGSSRRERVKKQTFTVTHPDKGKDLPLKGEDVRTLMLPSLRAARSPEERQEVFSVIVERNLHPPISEVLSLLKDPDPDFRRGGITILAGFGAKAAGAEIRRALKDSVAAVRISATRALGIIGGQDVVPDLLTILEDSSADVRERAAEVLGDLDVKEAVPALVRHLGDPSANVRERAAIVLGDLGAKEAVPALLEHLEDPDPQVRGKTVMSLAWMGAKQAAPALMKHLGDPDPGVRAYAVWGLGMLKATEAAPEVAKLLKDTSNNVRTHCVVVLSRLKGKGAVPDLMKALEDEDIHVQIPALSELGKLGAREAIPTFLKLLSSPAGTVQNEAAISLCKVGNREGVPTVLESCIGFEALNHLRRPEVCDRLQGRKYSGDFEGSTRKLVERVAQETGMTVDWPKDPSGAELPWASDFWYVDLIGESALACLYRATQESTFQLVLEEKQIRILPRDQAFAFWKAWWTEEEKKK